MKILFLTRVHPPVVGGLENQSYNLINNFKKINKEIFVVKNTKGKKALPIFLPYSFFKAVYLIWKNKITHLHLSDGLLAFEGLLIKKLTGVKTAVTIHGLDITFRNSIYQKITPKSINKLDKIICISNNTKKECIKRGISKNKCVVIPNGVNINEFILKGTKKTLRKKLSDKLNINLENKKILLTTGRLVKRKGVEWFISNVMPKLSKRYIYLVSGAGEEKEKIEKAIKNNKLDGNVVMLGRTSFDILKLLYNSADLFIMPNISVKGNIEGFGIVAIEAGSCGLPVLAANVDGISNAVIDGKSGWLVKERDVRGFVKRINGKSLNGRKVRAEVKRNFDWGKIAKKYLEVMG